MRWILLNMAFWVGILSAYASTRYETEHYRDSVYSRIQDEGSLKLSCYFTYLQGSSKIHKELGNNPIELSRLEQFLGFILSEQVLSIRRIRLTGYCSIEGTYVRNEQLAHERVTGFRDYLSETYPMLYRYPVDMAWIAEDWESLSRLLRQSNIADKVEMLNIIKQNYSIEKRKKELRKLKNGMPYKRIETVLFPLLRRVEITVEYDNNPVVRNTYSDISVNVEQDSIVTVDERCDPLIYSVLDRKKNVFEHSQETAKVIQVDNVSPEETIVLFSVKDGRGEVMITQSGKHFRKGIDTYWEPLFAVKTNLLYWASVTPDAKRTTYLPNFSIEYFFSRNWSVEAGYKYGNRHYDSKRQFQGMSGYRFESRYWFYLPQISQLSLFGGIYARGGDYNIRCFKEDKEITKNYTGKYWDTGISGGVYVGLTRQLGLEAGARVGYLHTRSTVYNLHEGHNCFDHYESYGKVRVTDLMCNLVYRFGR